MPSAKITLLRSASTCEIRSHGSGNSSAKSPTLGLNFRGAWKVIS